MHMTHEELHNTAQLYAIYTAQLPHALTLICMLHAPPQKYTLHLTLERKEGHAVLCSFRVRRVNQSKTARHAEM